MLPMDLHNALLLLLYLDLSMGRRGVKNQFSFFLLPLSRSPPDDQTGHGLGLPIHRRAGKRVCPAGNRGGFLLYNFTYVLEKGGNL